LTISHCSSVSRDEGLYINIFQPTNMYILCF
jgi:hypothetical protein